MNKDKEHLIYTNGEGGYIFISHSHHDIEKVRIIHNTLEANGYEPLCFYLKCLTNDDEVEGLIKREIDSRDIFLYIESPNSLDSEWVKKERAYINQCKNKTVYKIELDDRVDLRQKTLEILDRTRVYISYSPKDTEIYNIFKNKLIEKDLKVFDIGSIKNTDDYFRLAPKMIKEACEHGCFIILVSENSINSKEVMAELNIAYRQYKGRIFPIYIGNAEIEDTELEYYLIIFNYVRLTDIHDEAQIDNIVNQIKYYLSHKE